MRSVAQIVAHNQADDACALRSARHALPTRCRLPASVTATCAANRISLPGVGPPDRWAQANLRQLLPVDTTLSFTLKYGPVLSNCEKSGLAGGSRDPPHLLPQPFDFPTHVVAVVAPSHSTFGKAFPCQSQRGRLVLLAGTQGSLWRGRWNASRQLTQTAVGGPTFLPRDQLSEFRTDGRFISLAAHPTCSPEKSGRSGVDSSEVVAEVEIERANDKGLKNWVGEGSSLPPATEVMGSTRCKPLWHNTPRRIRNPLWNH